MAKKKMTHGGYELGRLIDQSGGMVDDVVYPALLRDTEAHLLKNVSLDEKGTIKVVAGRRERFADDFSPSPVNGLGAFYKSDGTHRLLIGAGSSLYVDTPHLTEVFDTQQEWERGTLDGVDASSGSLKPSGVFADTETTAQDFEQGTLSDVMTQDDNLVLAKGDISSGKIYSASHNPGVAGRAFDDDTGTYWYANYSGNVWIQVDLGDAKAVSQFRLYLGGSPFDNANVKKFKLQGSDNGIDFTDILTETTDAVSGWQEWEISNPGAYRYYRIYIINNHGGYAQQTTRLYEAELIRVASSGTRISPVKDISAITDVVGSKISWNGTGVTVETRLSDDGGDTWGEWQEAVNGGAIPEITEGMDLTNYRLQTKVTLSGEDPVLHSITLSVYSSRWISPVIDASIATDKASGHIHLEQTTPGTSSVFIESRSSSDALTWEEWTPADVDGTLNHTPDNFVQVRLTLRQDGENMPEVDKAIISFDGTPTTTLLSSNFTQGGDFFFATLLDYMVVTNGIDAPQKYDGDTLSELGGSPPRGRFVVAHKNYLFMANAPGGSSRLYFSDVLNLESWPLLNFIDISPNDGDYITGLLPFDDYLIIAKNRSIWVLLGSGPSDFEVRRIHDGVGCVAPRSLVRLPNFFAFVSSEGIYLSNLAEPVLITERLKKTWAGLNSRKLDLAAGEFYDHKLRMDLPNGDSHINNIRIIFDTIRQALYLEEFTEHASCYCKFTEAGKEYLLYGHANVGQVSYANTGTADNDQDINMVWETKWFDFGSNATEKKVKRTYLVMVPAPTDTTLKIEYIVDGAVQPIAQEILVPGSDTPTSITKAIRARDSGVRKIRSLGYRVTQSVKNGGVKIIELLQEFSVRKVRVSE